MTLGGCLNFLLIFLSAQCYSNCFGQTDKTISDKTIIVVDNIGLFIGLPTQIIISNTPGMVPGGGHIQGIQKTTIKGKDAFIFSGSSSTFSYYAVAYNSDKGYQVKDVRTILPIPYNHAGGIQVCDSLLAIGVEDTRKHNSSKIMLFDISNPGKSDNVALTEIDRKGAYKIATAGAVALTKIGNNYLLAVDDWNSEHIDFYRSNGKQPHDPGFRFDSIGSWQLEDYSEELNKIARKERVAYQAIQLYNDSTGGLQMIATGRKGGHDVLDSYHVGLHTQDTLILTDHIGMNRGKRAVFHCTKRVSFRFGGGIYLDDNWVKAMATQKKPHKKISINVFK